MTIRLATRSLAPFALLALLVACDRPKGPPPPKAVPASASSQAAPSTVALSGTILDAQPDPATVKPSRSVGGSLASASRSGAVGVGLTQDGADRQALRDFQAEQERRDRELLDQDLSEAELRAREPYELPREDGDWSSSDQRPPDEFLPDAEELMDEPPPEEPLYDDEPLDDEGYDPRDGAYRP